MIIMGLDCGGHVTGFGIVEIVGSEPKLVTCGSIKTKAKHSLLDRCESLYHNVNDLFVKYQIDECAIEAAYAGKFARSGLVVSQIIGMMTGLCFAHNIPVATYLTATIRKACIGRAKAGKEAIYGMMTTQYHIKKDIPYDTTDALAVATCHAYNQTAEFD